MHNLVLSGGVGHPFAQTSAMLADLLAPLGIRSEVAEPHEWDTALEQLPDGPPGVITVNALRWRMLSDRYDHLRDANGYTTTLALRRAISDHMARGGVLLSLHTSCICFDDWPEWGAMLGASWDWHTSFHPVLSDDVEVHVLTSGSTFTVTDELYHSLHVSDPDREVVVAARLPRNSFIQNHPPAGASGVGEWHPVMWRRTHGTGRVVVDTLGHDDRSMSHPVHLEALRSAVQWAVASQPG